MADCFDFGLQRKPTQYILAKYKRQNILAKYTGKLASGVTGGCQGVQ